MESQYYFFLPLASATLSVLCFIEGLRVAFKRRNAGFLFVMLATGAQLLFTLMRLVNAANVITDVTIATSWRFDAVILASNAFWTLAIFLLDRSFAEKYGSVAIAEMIQAEQNEKNYLALMMHRINKRNKIKDSFNLPSVVTDLTDPVLVKLNNPILFCGLKNSGKSATGRLVATKFGVDFYDVDEILLNRAKQLGYQSIKRLYYDGGSDMLHSLEVLVLKEIFEKAGSNKCVLALPGGICYDKEACLLARKMGKVIYLRAAETALTDGFRQSGAWPDYVDMADPIASFHDGFVKRDEFFKSMSSSTIQVDLEKGPEVNAVNIINQIIELRY